MSTGLKLLITTYSTAFLSIGGGESELVQVAETLNQAGIETDIYGVSSRPLEYYDVAMHFSVHPDGVALFNALISRDKKVMLWPNVWWLEKPVDTEIARIKALADRAHQLLFKSHAEKNNFLQYIDVMDSKCLVIPICVSNQFYAKPDIAIAQTVSHYEDYVLCLGRVEPIKNQLVTIQALNEIGKNGMMVGGSGDAEYMELCRKAGSGHVQFLPFVKPCSALLISLIANSKAVVELSYDPAGRSSLEAAAMKKPLVLSDDAWVDEYFSDTVYKANPSSVATAIAAIDAALNDQNKKTENAYLHTQQYSSTSALKNMVNAIVKAVI